MKCMTEETFGPTLPIMKVARRRRGACGWPTTRRYGLGASVFTSDVERGEAIARRLEAGAVNVNDAMINYTALELPMGGAKASGLGSRHGAGGIRKYCSAAGDRRHAETGHEEGTLHVPVQVAHVEAARRVLQVHVRPRPPRREEPSTAPLQLRRTGPAPDSVDAAAQSAATSRIGRPRDARGAG